MTPLERVARAIAPNVWADEGNPAAAGRRKASLAAARRVFGVIRSTGTRTCGQCDGQPECACMIAISEQGG